MVIRITKDNLNVKKLKPSVACIGYFDGVHLGHQRLIEETINEAKKLNVKSTVICFNPDPLDVITGEKTKHITGFKNRLNIFKSLGIDQIIAIKFDSEIMNTKPKIFIQNYLNRMNIVELICGFDFSFGYKGKGNKDSLIRYGEFKTIVIPELKYYGKKVSSTRIKNEICKGNLNLVNRLLGWDYFCELVVCDCVNSRNRYTIEAKLIDSSCILPKDGNYGDGFRIFKNRIYIDGSKKLNVGRKLLVSFSDYE